MYFRRRFVGAVGPIAVLGILAAACGAPGSNVNASKTCDVDPPKQESTVNVLAYSGFGIDPYTNAMASSKCNDIKNLTVRHSRVDFGGQLQKANLSLPRAKGQGSYDVVETYSASLVQYAGSGWLSPMDKYVDEYSKRYALDDFSKELLDGMTYEGHLYALPMTANVHIMTYRKDILDKLGIKPPTTFDELISAAKKIKTSKLIKYPISVGLGADSSITTAFNNSLTSLGGEWVDTKTDTPELNSPEAAEAIRSLQRLLPYAAPEALNFSDNDVQSQLLNGQAAIGLLYDNATSILGDPAQSNVSDKTGYAAAPSVNPGGKAWATVNIDGFSIAKNSSVSAKTLFQLVAVGTGYEPEKEIGRINYPARKTLLNDSNLSATAAFWAAGTDSIKNGATSYPRKTYFVAVQDAVRADIAAAVTGKMPIKEALDKAQKAAEKTIERYTNK